MTYELKDVQLNVRYSPESITASFKSKVWSFPRYSGRICVLCGNPLHDLCEVDGCGLCTRRHDLESVRYVGLYHHDNDDDLRRGIISLKYGRDFWADVLGMSMSLVLLNENQEVDEGALLVSVPSHVDDHPDRDYNPPDMLARRIATYTPTRYGPHLLEKMRPNIQKENATSEERFDAVRDLYRATRDINGQSVVLVDDVMTSGATLSACAEALRINGANAVHVLVAGRNFQFLEDKKYE